MKMFSIKSIVIALFIYFPVNSQTLPKRELQNNFKGFRLICFTTNEDSVFRSILPAFKSLQNNKLTCKKTKIKTTFNIRPTLLSVLFNRRTKREYKLRINNLHNDSIITLEKISLECLQGAFVHEMCHMEDYQNLSVFGLCKRGIEYVSLKKRACYEKRIDSMVIEKGYGEQLAIWSEFVLHKSDATVRYKQYKSEIYLKPDEIKSLIKKKAP